MSQSYRLSTYLALYIPSSANCWVGLSKSSEPSKKQRKQKKNQKNQTKLKKQLKFFFKKKGGGPTHKTLYLSITTNKIF